MKLSAIKKECIRKGTTFIKAEPVTQDNIDAHRKGFCSLGDTLVWMSVSYWDGHGTNPYALKVEKSLTWYEIFKAA